MAIELRPGRTSVTSVILKKGGTGICVLDVGVALWNPQILTAHPQSKALLPQFSILNPHFSFLRYQISFSNLNTPSSTLLSPSSVKSTGYLKKVRKHRLQLFPGQLPPLAVPSTLSHKCHRLQFYGKFPKLQILGYGIFRAVNYDCKTTNFRFPVL